MGLMTEILSFVRGGGETDTLFGVQQALAKLQSERQAATEALASFGQRRKAMLLDDASDKAIGALEREMDSHRLVLERLELLEDDLLRRARLLQSGERTKRIQELLKRHQAATKVYIEAHRAAARAVNGVTSVVDEAIAAGFGSEFSAYNPPIPRMLDLSQIAIYEQEIERIADAVAGRERQAVPSAPAPRRAPTVAKPATVGTPRRVFADAPAPVSERKTRELYADVAKPGEKLIRISRLGYETPDGRSCVNGDVVALPNEIATAVVRNVAGDYLDGASA